MKVCSKCGIEKDEIEFGKDSKKNDGYNIYCKKCRKIDYNDNRVKYLEYKKIEYRNNVNKYTEKNRKYNRNDDNKKKISKNKKDYYLNNKEKIDIQMKEYGLINRDLKLEYNKKYYTINKEKFIKQSSEYLKKRKKIDKSYKMKIQLQTCFRTSISNKNIKKNKSFDKYTGIAYADYITYFENNFPVEFAEITVKGKYHIDHIIPCAVYDFNNAEHIKLCWQPENLRIIPAAENLSKNDKLDIELIRKHKIEHLLPKDKGVKIW